MCVCASMCVCCRCYSYAPFADGAHNKLLRHSAYCCPKSRLSSLSHSPSLSLAVPGKSSCQLISYTQRERGGRWRRGRERQQIQVVPWHKDSRRSCSTLQKCQCRFGSFCPFSHSTLPHLHFCIDFVRQVTIFPLLLLSAPSLCLFLASLTTPQLVFLYRFN